MEISHVEKQEMLKHNVYTQDTIKEHYDELADNYEKVYLTVGWPDPRQCADKTIELVSQDQVATC